MKILGIIPARYDSTRFPGKPLVDISGKSMIQRVYERALKCKELNRLIIATDDERIYKEATSFNAEVIMTSKNHPSGTDRCNEVAQNLDEVYDYIINIQGDEPFIFPQQISQLCGLLKPQIEFATLAKKITDPKKLSDSNSVKVIFDNKNFAIYFSRHAIPFNRDSKIDDWLNQHIYYKHIGIYAYKSELLEKVCQIPRSSLEISESLEQLRWLENGYKIKIGITEYESPNIDSPEDLKKLVVDKYQKD